MGRNIGTSIPELYRSVDTNGMILDCNYMYAKRLGYSPEEVIGMPFLDHSPEQDRPRLKARFEEWLKTQTHTVGVVTLQTKSGETFDVTVAAEGAYDANNQLVGRNSILREMSHIKEMQKLYNVSAREGYEHPEVMHRSVNYNGIIIDTNQTYLDKLGYTKEEVVGVSLLHHTAPRSRGNLSAHMENWRNGLHDTAKIWMRRKDGSEFLVSLTATDERDDDGRLVGRTVALRETGSGYCVSKITTHAN